MTSQRQLSSALSLAALVVARREALERDGVRLPPGRCLGCADWDEPVVVDLDAPSRAEACPGCGHRPALLEVDRSHAAAQYTLVVSALDRGTPIRVRKTIVGVDPREVVGG